MNPDRRWLVLRTLMWIGVVVYAVSIIRDHGRSDSVGAAMAEVAGFVESPVAWTVLPRPGGVAGADDGLSAAASGEGTAVADPSSELLPRTPMGDVSEALTTFAGLFDSDCRAVGRSFRLSLGPGGLSQVTVDGAVDECVAGKIWGAAWPSVAPPVEIELGG